MSVSCLDIHYYVKSNAKMDMMDQKNEMESLVIETAINDFRSTYNVDNSSDGNENMHTSLHVTVEKVEEPIGKVWYASVPCITFHYWLGVLVELAIRGPLQNKS